MQAHSDDSILGAEATSIGQLNTSHEISIAPDGNLFVSDTNNNRIKHFSSNV